MFKRINKGLDVMKACWRVFLLDKELLVFPLLSAAVLGALLGIAIWPIWNNAELPILHFVFVEDETGEYVPNHVLMAAISLLGYLISSFVIVFFNSALIACVKLRFAGANPTVQDGFKAAISILPRIFIWSVFAAIIGWLLSLSRNEKGGALNFVVGLLGAGWAVAIYFVVPVLVSENLGPIQAVKRSVAVVRKTWGEALVGIVGFGVVQGAAGLLIFLYIFASAILFDIIPSLGAFLVGLGICLLVMLVLVFSTLGSILKAALYVYATTGRIPGGFDDNMIKDAFQTKE